MWIASHNFLNCTSCVMLRLNQRITQNSLPSWKHSVFFMTPSCKLVEKQVVFFFLKQKYIPTYSRVWTRVWTIKICTFWKVYICIRYPDIYPKSSQTLLFFIACWPPNVTREVIRCENFVEIIPVFSTFFNFFKKKKL